MQHPKLQSLQISRIIVFYYIQSERNMKIFGEFICSEKLQKNIITTEGVQYIYCKNCSYTSSLR